MANFDRLTTSDAGLPFGSATPVLRAASSKSEMRSGRSSFAAVASELDQHSAEISLCRTALLNLPTLRELAGHANVQMTMRYIHSTPEHKREAMKKLEQFGAGRLIALHDKQQSAHRER